MISRPGLWSRGFQAGGWGLGGLKMGVREKSITFFLRCGKGWILDEWILISILVQAEDNLRDRGKMGKQLYHLRSHYRFERIGIPRGIMAGDEGGNVDMTSWTVNWEIEKLKSPVSLRNILIVYASHNPPEKDAWFALHHQLTWEKHVNTYCVGKKNNTCTPPPRLGEAKPFHSRALSFFGVSGGVHKKKATEVPWDRRSGWVRREQSPIVGSGHGASQLHCGDGVVYLHRLDTRQLVWSEWWPKKRRIKWA